MTQREQVVEMFLDGLKPLVALAMAAQPLPIARKVADSIAAGRGHIVLNASLGKDGDLALEVVAKLEGYEHRLLTIIR